MRTILSCAIGLALMALPASAATFKAVYTGTVNSSSNQTGEFGTTEVQGLDGLDFVLTFIYDPSVGLEFSNSAIRSVSGGTITATSSPIIMSSISINGVTRTVDGAFAGSVGVQVTEPCPNCLDSVDHFAQAFVSAPSRELNYALSAQILDFDLPIPLSLTTPFGFTVPAAPLSSFGFFSFFDSIDGVLVESVSGSLTLQTVSVSEVRDVSPVPLPAGLPLLLAGLGALAVVRKRRA